LSKTGFIREAGRCLLMQTIINNEPVIIVLLDSYGKYTRIADAKRIRKWMEKNVNQSQASTQLQNKIMQPS
jgi:D-alanyl-D-alanine endopeptidase (penicillin-binding protein 7)